MSGPAPNERPVAPEPGAPDAPQTNPATTDPADAPQKTPAATDPRAAVAALGLGEWVRAHRAKLEILLIAAMAIGGIVCMVITTLALIFGLRR
ncbi:MAG: hypothetical protein IT337_11495 [Thermomicrobiales bacterium]|nr:hypothetical protein [Thermomicrobiales bacterium]